MRIEQHAQTTGRSQATSGTHLAFVDWVRVIGSSLVVLHHSFQVYADQLGATVLQPILTINAGFGMAVFFFVAGYFVPASLDSNGPVRFARQRLIGLGIPLGIFALVVFAVISYRASDLDISFGAYFLSVYIGQWQVTYGPLWFIFHLLVYSLVAAGVFAVTRLKTHQPDAPLPGHRAIVAMIAAIALVGGAVQSVWPMATWTNLFGFLPTEPAHLPQYVAFFAFGIYAGRIGWLRRVPRSTALVWGIVGWFAAIWWYLAYLKSGQPPLEQGFGFALWEAVLCVGLTVGLMVAARELLTRSGPIMSTLSKASYGVFLLHFLLVIGFSVALRPYGYGIEATVMLNAGLSIVISFALSVWLLTLLNWRARCPAPELELHSPIASAISRSLRT